MRCSYSSRACWDERPAQHESCQYEMPNASTYSRPGKNAAIGSAGPPRAAWATVPVPVANSDGSAARQNAPAECHTKRTFAAPSARSTSATRRYAALYSSGGPYWPPNRSNS